MTKRTPQQPPRTPKAARLGLVVYENGQRYEFKDANSWGIDANGLLGIGIPGNRQDANGNPINDTIATFRAWDRVGWLDVLKA